MPYIKFAERIPYDTILNSLTEIKTKGDLEYCITKLMNVYMATRQYRYSTLHDCVYAAAHCSDEYRRRYLDKREDEAINENGDV